MYNIYMILYGIDKFFFFFVFIVNFIDTLRICTINSPFISNFGIFPYTLNRNLFIKKRGYIQENG